jgi:hypothetical protein
MVVTQLMLDAVFLASFEKCVGGLVNWIVKYHFSTSSVSMKDTTKQCKVRF